MGEDLEEEDTEQKKIRKKRKGRHQQIVDEWEELAAEERLHKQLKRGKISKAEYEKEIRKVGRDIDDNRDSQDDFTSDGNDSDDSDDNGNEPRSKSSRSRPTSTSSQTSRKGNTTSNK